MSNSQTTKPDSTPKLKPEKSKFKTESANQKITQKTARKSNFRLNPKQLKNSV